ncbi:hypothetical protein HK297_09210, partial [Streptococcus agalactiae]|nr:hypothetical protein [Streptococcus agalactiae]
LNHRYRKGFYSLFKTLQQNQKLIKEISLIDLTDLMKSTLKANEKQLQKQIDFWQREFRFWK